MKGFFITAAVLVALILAAFTQLSTVCQSFYDKTLESEGGQAGKEAFDRMKLDAPAEFAKKYEEALRQRLFICKVAYFGREDAMFRTVGNSTRELYLDSPLAEKNDGLAQMLHRLAMSYESDGFAFYERLKEIVERFPGSPVHAQAENQLKLIKVRLNISGLSLHSPFC